MLVLRAYYFEIFGGPLALAARRLPGHQQYFCYTRVEARSEAEERCTSHVAQMYQAMLMRKAKSWFTGYNSNVGGHEAGKIRHMVYNGGAPKYVETLVREAESGYRV